MARILCVDDDRNLCRILARALSGEGYDVRTANDGDEALRAFRADPPDCVLLDLVLPRRDGFEVLAALRSQTGAGREVPVVLISGCTRTPQYAQRAEALSATAFLTKPVPLESLFDVVRKAVSGSPRAEVARAGRSEAGGGPARPLSGTLDEVAFPSLLHHLHGLRASGALHLRLGNKRKWIQIRDGFPVAIRSNLVDETLGKLLVRMGRIDDRSLAESVKRVRRGEGLQGEILCAMEVLDEDELATALRVQANEKLFEIFEWTGGTFRFERDGRVDGANALALDSRPADVVLGGVRSRFPMERIDRFLRPRSEHRVAAAESPFYRFQEIDLEPTERRLLERLDKGPRIAELLEADEASRRVLYALLSVGLLELRREGEPVRSSTDTASVSQATRSAVEDGPLRAELTEMAERMRGADYFEVLGIDRSADEETIRAAYVHLAKRTHPDRFSGNGDAVRKLAEEVFKLVSQAEEVLGDAGQREAYRRQLHRGAREAAELEEGRRALAAEHEFQRGEQALRRRAPEAAFRCFERAVGIFPEEPEYLGHQGWARYLCNPDDAEAVKRAETELRRAAKLAPDREKPFVFLGRLLRATGREGSAERAFMRAVQIAPECVEALRELRLIRLRAEKRRGLLGRLIFR